ncbi:MAG: tRNA pseudouridine(55) synthase TruB [bacterium]
MLNRIAPPDSQWNPGQFNGAGELLLFDKPLEWTSMDAITKVRHLFQIDKAGHAGTLDPKATGLLILCTGRKTKELNTFMGLEKEYRGRFELGIHTPSFDTETSVAERKNYDHVTQKMLEETFIKFTGKQTQVPPMYSAVKYKGKPLYKYARKGRTVEREAKVIDISLFDLLRYEAPYVDFRVICSKGTYIRSLVNDLGIHLSCGASLLTLRRTRIGEYRIEDAFTYEELKTLSETIKLSAVPYHESDAIHTGH